MAAAEPQNNSLAYVSREPDKLDKFVSLEQGQNGRITINQTRINELEGLLNAAVNVIGGLNMGEINARVAGIVNTLMSLQSINFDIYSDISLNFEDYSVIHDSLNVIAHEINPRVGLVNLPSVVRNIRNLAAQPQQPQQPPLPPQLQFKFIVLQPNDSGWQTIKNTVQAPVAGAAPRPAIDSKLHSKTGIDNESNIENQNVSNTETINKYLDQCEEHQTAYIAKHNEIKKLFEHLKSIIELIKLILDVIRTLSQVKSVQKRRRIGALPSVKIPKELLGELATYQQDQQTILNTSNKIINKAVNASRIVAQQGGFFQLGGAAAAAQQQLGQQQQKIILAEDSIQVPPELAEILTPGDIIKITMQASGQQQPQLFSIKITERQLLDQNTFNITIIPEEANIDAFNALTYQQQQAAMTLNRLGIDHSGFLSVAGHLEQMMRNSFIEFDRQLDRMQDLEIQEARAATNDTDHDIPFDEEHQPEIQNILYNCYDLQILYLIKHVEVVNLFKFILFHYDILLNNLAILINLLKLFDVLEINIQTILGNVSVRSIIQNMRGLVADQRNAMQSIFHQPPQGNNVLQSGGAAAVPELNNNQLKSQLPQDLQEENEIDRYITEIREALQDSNIQYEDEKISALEKSIGDAIIRISKEQEPNQENKAKKEKLYKAYRAIRILRLRKLEKTKWANHELKNHAEQQIVELKKEVGTDDLFTAIYRMKGQDDILADVYSKHAKQQLDKSPFTKAPVEGQRKELQQILDNYYKTRNPQVCKVGDPNSCSKKEEDVNSAEALIKKTFQDVFGAVIQDNMLDYLKQHTTLKLFQLADYLYYKYQKKEDITYDEIKNWLSINGYDNFLRIVLEKSDREEEARRAREAEARSAEEETARHQEELEKHKLFLETTIKPLGRLKSELFYSEDNINTEYQASWNTFLKEYKPKGQTINPAAITGILRSCHELINVESTSVQYDDDNFRKIKSIIGILDNYPNLLANLREVIFQACRVVVKIRSENEEDKEDKKPSSQSGGYRMNDVITVEKVRDTSTIKLGNICKKPEIGISDDKQRKQYGPFSAVYLPGDTQEYVYKELFGDKVFNQESSQHTTAPRASQGLMEQLKLGKNVVIFGFGFSGSGKTYTLIEGASNPVESGGAAAGAGDTRQKSLLELFILDNINFIQSVNFSELYPKENQEYTKKIKSLDFFQSIKSESVAAGEFIKSLKSRLKQIEEHRYKHLTICATPNNDNSSRSFLMIKLILVNGASLVFFDMPGTESTVRIRSQFMGNVFYSETEKTIITDKHNTAYTASADIDKIYTKIPEFLELYTDNTTSQNIKVSIILKTTSQANTQQTKPLTPQDKIKLINDYYEEIKLLEGKDKPITSLGVGYALCPIENHFKESIITAAKLQKIFIDTRRASHQNEIDKIQLQTAKYIITMSEAITLFFNGYPEKTFREFLLNNASATNDIYIKMLTPDKMLEIVKTFLSGFIYKKKADGSETYKYFTLDQSSETQLDDDIKTNVIKIFNLHLSSDESKKGGLLLKDFNFVELPFYEIVGVEEEKIQFKQNGFFRDVKFDNKFIMIKCFIMMLCYVLQKIDEKTTTIAILKSDNKNSNSYYGLSMVLILTYKFINFIIEQGESIMTTLEHLKYYFLFNMNSYDKLDKFKCFSAPIPKEPTKRQSIKSSRPSTQATTKPTQPQEKECGNLLYLTNPASYTYDTKIGDSILKEKVVIGGMVEYGLMSLLQKLNGREPDLTKLLVKTRPAGETYLDLALPVSQGDGAAAAVNPLDKKALFVMFANIKAHVRKEDAAKDYDDSMLENIKLICNAEVDTLEFAQSVSSTAAQPMREPAGAGYGDGDGDGAGAGLNGGALKSSRIKKYLTSRMKQYTLKRLNKSGHKSIYSRRSRKYQA